MTDPLKEARDFAERVRFSGDASRSRANDCVSRFQDLKSYFYGNELRISKEVTPALDHVLREVCEHLCIPLKSVNAFIYPDPMIQAGCLMGSKDECVIRFSSSLIEILDESEFAFVAGHELGHFLLNHGAAGVETENASLEYFIQKRAQEISVDRMGLIASGSLDVAVKAMMKSASGLTSKHLRFDVASFISQLKHSSLHDDERASHPSMFFRCRALLWFSVNDVFLSGWKAGSAETLSTLDDRIQKDLHKYVDGPARERIQETKDDLEMWMAAYEIVKDGVFSTQEQALFEERFGKDDLGKLKNFFKDVPVAQVQKVVQSKVEEAREALEQLIPEGFDAAVEKIGQWSETR